MLEKHPEWPDLEQYADVPIMNMKAVVKKTGISSSTLRAWERRYKILSPDRAQNAYRLYSEQDVAIIQWLKDRVDTGMSISQAIALFRYLEIERSQRRSNGTQQEKTSPPQGVVPAPAASKLTTLSKGSEQENVETYNLRFVREQLLNAFKSVDEDVANNLMAAIMAVYSLEQVCAELISPALWEIGNEWEQGQLTVAVEHFASAFFHSWLTSLLHAMPSAKLHPLVITCCAPGELHELASLMLSLLLRRAGIHVAYLGQSIETDSLLQMVRQLSPTLICISATLVSSGERLIEIGQRVQELPMPHPVMIFGGQAFKRDAHLISQVPGMYLEGNLQTIISQLRFLALQPVGEK